MHKIALVTAALVWMGPLSAGNEAAVSPQKVSIIHASLLSNLLNPDRAMTVPLVAVFDSDQKLVGYRAGWKADTLEQISLMATQTGHGPNLRDFLDLIDFETSVSNVPTLLTVSINDVCTACSEMESEVGALAEVTPNIHWIRLQVQPSPRS